MSLDIQLHRKQLAALQTPATEVLFGGSAGSGKAQAIDTEVLTDKGFRKLGDLKVGDRVFGRDGKICNIVAMTDVMYDRDCYELEFDTGEKVIADAQHQWLTHTDKDRVVNTRRCPEWREARRQRRKKRGTGRRPDLALMNSEREQEYLPPVPMTPKTTEAIFHTQLARDHRTNHSIECCDPLEMAERDFVVDPYVLGVWLSDGSKSQAQITTGDPEVFEKFDGYTVTKSKCKTSPYGYNISGGLRSRLRQIGVLTNKHIPEEYLLADYHSRLMLLKGFMDSDGSADKSKGNCQFYNTNKDIVDGVAFLVRSLGMKASVTSKIGKLYGVEKKRCYTVTFKPHISVFEVSRKGRNVNTDYTRPTQLRHYIKSVRKVDSVPVKCIQVDSPDNTFLTTRSLIPTHNSHLLRVASIIWAAEIPGIQIYLLRRLGVDLYKNHVAGPGGFSELLAPWLSNGMVRYDSQKNRFLFWHNSAIWLCHCQYEKNLLQFQGSELHALCTRLDEDILLPDGNYKKMKDLRVGDMVQTLIGPRPVSKVFSPRVAECVKYITPYGEQVCPTDHPVLRLGGGWKSWDDEPPVVLPVYNFGSKDFSSFVTVLHPYSGQPMLTNDLTVCEVTTQRAGDHEVVDVTISDANHYITRCGIINQNCIDEATHFTGDMYRYLRGRCRIGSLKLPDKYKGQFPRILAGTNPGGVGHNFFKSEFVDLLQPMEIRKMPSTEGGMMRQYVPAKLMDNPTLALNDPEYADKLMSLGDPALVRAMLEGDWNIVSGGALDDVWGDHLVIPQFDVPANWYVDRSFDWGSTHPFSVCWWAVANGEQVVLPNGDIFCPAPGSIIQIEEWYGAENYAENKGLRMSASDIAAGIIQIERRMKDQGKVKGPIRPGPADSQIYAVNERESGSIADKMAKEGVKWVPADKSSGSRVNGLQLVRDRMKNASTGEGPAIYFMSHCRASIATLPVLARDRVNSEDVDTKGIDHCFSADTRIEVRGVGIVEIASAPESGEVMTRFGWRRYYGRRMTRANAEVMWMYFSDGTEVVCTPDHRFLTEYGWMKAEEIYLLTVRDTGDHLTGWKYKTLQEYTKNVSNSKELDTISVGITSSKAEGDCTEKFGSPTTGRFPINTISTTLTRIRRIIGLKTLNWSIVPSTFLSTVKTAQGKIFSVLSGKPKGSRKNGTVPVTGGSGILNTMRMLKLPFTRKKKQRACIATRTLSVPQKNPSIAPIIADQPQGETRGLTTKQGFAQCASSRLRLTSIKKQDIVLVNALPRADVRNVYCITVPSVGEFVLADSGIVVKNCFDSLRYRILYQPKQFATEIKVVFPR